MIARTAASPMTGSVLVHGEASGEVVYSDVGLSFWGGVDATSGEVIDRHHPLSGCSLAGKVLAIPGGRGSCSGSGVVLELLLNGKCPSAILLDRDDDIIALGVIVAEEVFGRSIPVVRLDPADHKTLVSMQHVKVAGGCVELLTGEETCAPSADQPPEPAKPPLSLTEADRAFLEGHHGKAAQVAMKITLRMAALQGAERLIDVTQAHIDGCVYTGPGSLQFASRLRDWGAKVRVPTSLNAISVDHRSWRAQGIDPSFGVPASQLADAYTDMGARPTFTCAPYLLDTAPAKSEQVVWAESNAVVYANSVLGARTMKYPDYLDICIALTGRTPLAGCHLEAERRATLQIALPEMGAIDDSFYPLLGYHAGALAGHRIPVLTGLENAKPGEDDLKAFGAAFATTSSAPMFHIVGVTPEAATFQDAVGAADAVPVIRVTASDLAKSWRELNSAEDSRVDLVALGNPHFSFAELKTLAEFCRGRRKNPSVSVMVTCGRAVLEKAETAGIASELERFGVRLVTDTCWCMIIEPLFPPTAKTIMTNSAKYAHYGPGLSGRRFHFGSLAACVEAACTGEAGRHIPDWL